MTTIPTEALYERFLGCSGISTDTRTVNSGDMFFALKGPNFNANKFAAQAIEKGASFAVVDEEGFVQGERFLLVEDALQALQALARYHRDQFSIPFIGITGSNGKTTTKELMRDVLATTFRVQATRGNLNNHIGVPLTILSIGRDVEIAIIEMGANHVGEIAALSAIANPTHGLITNIGKAHLEGFGGIEGIIRGKSELYQHLIANNGVIFVNSRQEVLRNMAERRMKNPYFYPEEGNYFHAKMISSSPYISFESGGETINTQLTGQYNFDNICAALCVGQFFGVSASKANKAVADYVADNNRSQVILVGEKKILLDAYNANPTSMQASIENLAEAKGVKAAILGDMLELGEDAEKEHSAIGLLTKKLGLDEVFFCGPLMKYAYEANSDARYFETKKELAEYLESDLPGADIFLIKGSRGMGLESILELIKK